MSEPAPARLGVVTGLIAEADCVGRAARGLGDEGRPLLFCSGADAARAEDGARRLLADGVSGLVSFGIAGGLDPEIAPGGLVLADVVVTPEGERIASDAGWRDRLLAVADDRHVLRLAPVAGSNAPVTCAAAKRALRNATGAAVADMESHAVAKAAAAAGLPFLALRAVADPAERAVPSCALFGVGPDGRIRALPVLRKLILKPWELPALVVLSRDMAVALAALSGVAESVLRALAPI